MLGCIDDTHVDAQLIHSFIHSLIQFDTVDTQFAVRNSVTGGPCCLLPRERREICSAFSFSSRAIKTHFEPIFAERH